MTSIPQTRAIHALRRRIGMNDADYRAHLKAKYNVESSTLLVARQAEDLILELKGLAGDAPSSSRLKAKTASGEYAPVLQALWICAWNLGVVRSRDDAAMLAYVERQTGLSHSRFLKNAGDASKAIEGLKAWIAREAKLEWPTQTEAEAEGRSLSWMRKRVVARAIARRLFDTGGFTPFAGQPDIWPSDIEVYGYRRGLPNGFPHYDESDWDRLCGYLGARLRATLAALAKAKPGRAA